MIEKPSQKLRIARGIVVKALAAWPYILITLVALVARAWSIDFSGTSPYARPDEEIFIKVALRLFSAQDPQTLAFGWPALFFYIIHGAQRFYSWWLHLRTGTQINLGCLYGVDPIRITHLGRYVSCILGTATIPLAIILSRKIIPTEFGPTARKTAGIVGGIFMALNYLHARDSHFAVSDVTLLFFLTISLIALLEASENGRLIYWFGAGAFFGLAASTKYTAFGLVPVYLAASILILIFRQNRARNLVGILLALAASFAIFVAINPRVFADWNAFIRGLLSHTHRFQPNGMIYNYDRSAKIIKGSVYHSQFTLPLALGWATFIASISGIVLGFLRPNSSRGISPAPNKPRLALRPSLPHAIVALWAILFFALVLGPSTTLFLRYTMPIMVALSALAAFAIVAIIDRYFATRLSERRQIGIATIAALVFALAPAKRIVDNNIFLSARDTRDLAAEWIIKHSTPGQKMVTFGGYAQVHSLDADTAKACKAVLPKEFWRETPELFGQSPDAGKLANLGRRGWAPLASHTTGAYTAVTSLEADWIIQGTPIYHCGYRGRSDGTRTLPSCFSIATIISPGKPTCDTKYDTFDSFFGPVANFEGVERMGPELTIWRNDCRSGIKGLGQEARPSQ